MRVVYRGTSPLARGSLSFLVSGCLHGGVLAWVMFGGTGQPQPRAQSIYDQEIRPNEKKIVWYSLREKLPEISPADTQADVRPPRAKVRAPQTMVAGARDDARPAPLIWAPEPEAAVPKAMPLPNVVAMAPPKLVRPFVVPPEKAAAVSAAASLPEAPDAKPRSGPQVGTPVAALIGAANLGPVKPSGPVRAFTPPPGVRIRRQTTLPLPEGPQAEMAVEANALPFPVAGPRPPPRAFVAPTTKARAATAASPVISAEPPIAPLVPGAMAEASLAIVGLNPAKTTEVPAPESRAAGFSAGTEPRTEGGSGANGISLLNVPGLTVRGGAKDTQPTMVTNFSPTSRENLLAAARVSMAPAPRVPAESRASHVVAPDARFAGRMVYAMAIQMPNVTSFSGSWLVWFAESAPLEGPAPREMRPPAVVRKVDPKYIAAAAAERVEGTVRLFGVIGKDGHVGRIALLRQLDERLDRSAQEALAKWEFAPALRDGVAVDVDAIFEIPFHLAPRSNQ